MWCEVGPCQFIKYRNLLGSNQIKNSNLSKNIEIWLSKTVLALVYKIITVTVDIHKL